jgi:arginyl-tRNA synthetase
MPSPSEIVASRLGVAFATIDPDADPVLRLSDHADFQSNGALGLAKRLGRNPAEVARSIVELAELDDVCERVEVSGPGFINLTLSSVFIAAATGALAADERLGVPVAPTRQRVVVDYSAPNVAKEMHVGHLRGTVLGDALCRILAFVGHWVIRENHIGDWGTPFGMLIEHLLDIGEEAAISELSVGDLTEFYQGARVSFDRDAEFRDRARRRVVALQAGDEETLRLWRVLVAESISYFDEVYTKLGVLLTDDDLAGESSYNSQLIDVVDDLRSKGLLVESEGALCVFPEGFVDREGKPFPLIIQKSDDGFGYAATDLATIRDRVSRLRADRILYVVGAPQAQHFQMCFAVARLAGWLPASVEVEHVSFGNVLGADHKMLRTRSGESVKLVELLDEAVARAQRAIEERDQGLSDLDRVEVARMLGIGAVKYADLSTERVRDYLFDFDRMLAFEGNTAPYLQYAHARIRSIFRRGGFPSPEPGTKILVDDPHERELALSLLSFPDHLGSTLAGLAPNRLCAYLFSLATAFTGFYENCPILRAEGEVQASRLALSDLTARTLALGLSLLGISVPEQM